MTEQYDSLNEKSKLIDVALKYTDNDMAKAKDMVSDQYLDVIVVKGRFLIEEKNHSGMFLAFFNHASDYISNVTSIISSKPDLYDKTRIFDNWKTLYKDIMTYRQGSGMIDSQNFTYFLIDSFAAYAIFPDVKEQKLDALTNTFEDIISKSFDVESAKCQIEFESTSSLAMELADVPIDYPGSERNEAPVIPEDERITKIESEAKYIIEGVAVVAPVRGKNINELNPGDKIKVLLPGRDSLSEKILKLLNAYDAQGQRLPITGRIKGKIAMDKNGYLIYAFVAKGVLAKIYEGENVKIMIESAPEEFQPVKLKINHWIIYIMGIVVGFIILCGIILFLIL